jgi:diketogulonate reductase-like aldo/keto reductase
LLRAVAPLRPRIPDIQAYSGPIEPADELREACGKLGIEFVSYSTLGTQHRYRRNPKRGGELEKPVLAFPAAAAVAARRGRSAAEVVLAWALARNMSVIPRSGNREHVRELAASCPAVGGDAAGHVVRGCLRCHSASGRGRAPLKRLAGRP